MVRMNGAIGWPERLHQFVCQSLMAERTEVKAVPIWRSVRVTQSLGVATGKQMFAVQNQIDHPVDSGLPNPTIQRQGVLPAVVSKVAAKASPRSDRDGNDLGAALLHGAIHLLEIRRNLGDGALCR